MSRPAAGNGPRRVGVGFEPTGVPEAGAVLPVRLAAVPRGEVGSRLPSPAGKGAALAHGSLRRTAAPARGAAEPTWAWLTPVPDTPRTTPSPAPPPGLAAEPPRTADTAPRSRHGARSATPPGWGSARPEPRTAPCAASRRAAGPARRRRGPTPGC